MNLWFVFALMTAAAIFAVLLPLGLGKAAKTGGNEAAVYRDQLAEIDRDAATGLVGPAEAEAARVEIGRRLLAVADQMRMPPTKPNTGLRRGAAVLALRGAAAAGAGGLSAARIAAARRFSARRARARRRAAQPLESLVAQVEQHLEKNPTDGRGWNVLAPVLAAARPLR